MSPLATKAIALFIGAAIVTLSFAATSAQATPSESKVTICHRTNSVTNPYRRITVSRNAADGAGRNDHTSHDESYTSPDNQVHPVFDPTVVYPSNQKDWGDIVPPIRSGSGLNWSVAGQAIYLGTGDSFGLCGALSAKQYYDAQLVAGIAPAVILAELDEQGASEDAALISALGGRFSDLDPTAFPSAFNLMPARPAGARPPSTLMPEEGTQRIGGVVWFDLDRDGNYDSEEFPAPLESVSIDQIFDFTSAGFGSFRTIKAAVTAATTDLNGSFENIVDPGQYEATVTPPLGYEVTYDSEGVNDGIAQTEVPANSFGFVWVGLAAIDGSDGSGGSEAGGAASGAATLASTGPSDAAASLVVALTIIGLGLVSLIPRRSTRRNASQAR